MLMGSLSSLKQQHPKYLWDISLLINFLPDVVSSYDDVRSVPLLVVTLFNDIV